MQIAAYIDHTLLKPTTTTAEIETLCREAAGYGFAAVCVPPPFVKRAKTLLEPTLVKVATVIGFPFGYAAIEAKVAETVLAIIDGADELDMVANLIAIRNSDDAYLEKEIATILPIVRNKQKILKVIIESGILTDEEIIRCCTLYGRYGVDFVKTSTGYAEKGASLEAVALMRSNLPPQVQIKASGGIRNYAFASALLAAGATRLGCSASIAIVQEAVSSGT
jgi:deoxyribose-phosphate aldolase